MKIDGAELLRDLRASFATNAPGIPWLDAPAGYYAIAAWESGFELRAARIDTNGVPSIGLWQFNMTAEIVAKIGELSGDELDDVGAQISYLKKYVSAAGADVLGAMARAVDELLARVSAGETEIMFNPSFDAPLWLSIAWQYGTGALVEWIRTPHAPLGETGFADWYLRTHGRRVQSDYIRRQHAVRAAYSMVMDHRAVAAGLLAAARKYGVDFVHGAKEGFEKLAGATGVPAAIADAGAWGHALEQRVEGGMARLEADADRWVRAFNTSIQVAAFAFDVVWIAGAGIGAVLLFKLLSSPTFYKAVRSAA